MFGLLSGVGLIIFGQWLMKILDEVSEQKTSNPIGLESDGIGILDDNEFKQIGGYIFAFGIFVFFLSFLGTFAISNKMFLYMFFYSTICLCSSLTFSPVIILRLIKFKKFEEDFRNHLRMWWLAVAYIYPGTTKMIEESNSCCGWNNVFDYCSKEAMGIIMYDTMISQNIN